MAVVKRLVEMGANVNAKNDDNETPAEFGNDPELAEWLNRASTKSRR